MPGVAATASSMGLGTQLEGVVGREHVRTDDGALLTYSTDATPLERGRPDAVVFPATAEEVAAVLCIAGERRVPVVPRGSGTNLSGGAVPHRGGIVLVLTRMNAIKEVSDAELVATAAEHIARYKLPKEIVRVDAIARSASGKPDYAWARSVAAPPR